MTQHLHPQNTHSNLKLKDYIFHILEESNSVMTLDEILASLIKHNAPYDLNKLKIRRLVNKLARKGLLEYVYIDHSYGVRMVNFHNKNEQIETVT